jgi:hypothetical protein
MRTGFLVTIVSLLQVITLTAPAAPSVEAARRVANNDPVCREVQPFYWEIGTAQGPAGGGQSGGNKYDRKTSIRLASGSKWIFSAVVLEYRMGRLTPDDFLALQMKTGFTNFEGRDLLCKRLETVSMCMNRLPHNQLNQNRVGVFSYGPGNFQHWSDKNGLGQLRLPGLNLAYQKFLGRDFGMAFWLPEPAMGLQGSVASYASFLMNVLSGRLQLSKFLGRFPVCTQRQSCPSEAVSSPVPYAWHYSLGHWIEDDPRNPYDDKALSSPGAFGFYPWISADRRFYGIVAREDWSKDAYMKSVSCGQRMRKAFLSDR